MFEELQELVPILIPLAVIWLGLMVAALLDLRKQAATRGPKWIWAVAIVGISWIGPVLYYALGRKEE